MAGMFDSAARRVARCRVNGRRADVLESDRPDGGTITLACDGHSIAVIIKEFGLLPPLADQPTPHPFAASYFQRVLKSGPDVLGEQVLEDDSEPSLERIAPLLPPLVDYTFLGDDTFPDRPLVRPDGGIEGYFEALEPFNPSRSEQHWRHALLDGWLPAIHFGFWDESRQRGFEEIAFAAPDEQGHCCVWVRIRRADARGFAEPEYNLCPAMCDAEPSDFYTALADLVKRSKRMLAAGSTVSVPEHAVQMAYQAGRIQGLLTFAHLEPRYGVGEYAAPGHRTFPPAVTALALCCTEWGDFERAQEVLGYYLEHFVRDDGTIDYYGPALAEYGQILAVAARIVVLSRDLEWLKAHLTPLVGISERLLTLRAAAKQAHPTGSPFHGLIPGLPEADYHDQDGEWERIYYSGDAWAARGLMDFGKMLAEAAQMHDDAADAERAETLLRGGKSYAADIRASVAQCQREADGLTFVPATPDDTVPFPTLTCNVQASYCNYRYFPEMLSSAVLGEQTEQAIIRYRRERGGEVLGTTRFMERLDDWPVWHVAEALLRHDDIPHLLLLFYGHLAHHQSQGTFTSYEQVEIAPRDGLIRHCVAGQCLPCQVTIPLILKRMLVYEEPSRNRLWLLRAAPKSWLRAGATIRIENAPTRWGQVTFEVHHDERGEVKAVVEPAQCPFPAEIRLRLRLPEGLRIARVVAEDAPSDIAVRDGTLIIPPGTRGAVSLTAEVAAPGPFHER